MSDAGAKAGEQPARLFLHGGLSGIVTNEGAKISAAGLRLSRADVAVAPQYTFGPGGLMKLGHAATIAYRT